MQNYLACKFRYKFWLNETIPLFGYHYVCEACNIHLSCQYDLSWKLCLLTSLIMEAYTKNPESSMGHNTCVSTDGIGTDHEFMLNKFAYLVLLMFNGWHICSRIIVVTWTWSSSLEIRVSLVPSSMLNSPVIFQGGAYFVDLFRACHCHTVSPVPCSLMVTCWERTDLLALLCLIFSCGFELSRMVPWIGVWYLIVSIFDLCLLPYFEWNVEDFFCWIWFFTSHH